MENKYCNNKSILLLEEKDKYYVSVHDNFKILNDQSFYGLVREMDLITYIIIQKMEN